MTEERLIKAFKEVPDAAIFTLASIGYGLYFKNLSKKEMNHIITEKDDKQKKFFEEYGEWLSKTLSKEEKGDDDNGK